MKVNEKEVLGRLGEFMQSEKSAMILSRAMINLVMEKIKNGDEVLLGDLVEKLMKDDEFIELLQNLKK